ncbi:unnamed protein product [Closterium sp. Naga37s-1]|nr:unnamed protein product [Closterium sp. Naga37s-1]
MGLRSARVALLCAVVVVVSLSGLGGGKLGVEAIKGSDLKKPFECDKNSDYGMWYRYTCVVRAHGVRQQVAGVGGVQLLGNRAHALARQPYRGVGRQLCYISNIRGRYKELFVGNGYVPPSGKVNGRPWNWNPEPPYFGNNWRSWAWDEKPY